MEPAPRSRRPAVWLAASCAALLALFLIIDVLVNARWLTDPCIDFRGAIASWNPASCDRMTWTTQSQADAVRAFLSFDVFLLVAAGALVASTLVRLPIVALVVTVMLAIVPFALGPAHFILFYLEVVALAVLCTVFTFRSQRRVDA